MKVNGALQPLASGLMQSLTILVGWPLPAKAVVDDGAL